MVMLSYSIYNLFVSFLHSLLLLLLLLLLMMLLLLLFLPCMCLAFTDSFKWIITRRMHRMRKSPVMHRTYMDRKGIYILTADIQSIDRIKK